MNSINPNTPAAASARSHKAFAEEAETALRHIRRLAIMASWTVSNEARRADDAKSFTMPDSTIEDVFALTRAIEEIVTAVMEKAQ